MSKMLSIWLIEKYLYKMLKHPAFATFVLNCCFSSSRLFIIVDCELRCTKGTTQDDPIAMIIYAIATISFILIILEIMQNEPGRASRQELWQSWKSYGAHCANLNLSLFCSKNKIKRASIIFNTNKIKITLSEKKNTSEFLLVQLSTKMSTWMIKLKIG